jgi:hypothetical protein
MLCVLISMMNYSYYRKMFHFIVGIQNIMRMPGFACLKGSCSYELRKKLKQVQDWRKEIFS